MNTNMDLKALIDLGQVVVEKWSHSTLETGLSWEDCYFAVRDIYRSIAKRPDAHEDFDASCNVVAYHRHIQGLLSKMRDFEEKERELLEAFSELTLEQKADVLEYAKKGAKWRGMTK
jgi:hypothetical protein